MCLSLCACGSGKTSIPANNEAANGGQNGTNGENNDTSSTNNNVDADWIVREERINVLKLRKVIETVELTAENWQEHFKVYSYSYTEEKVEKDAFGEIISTETITHNGRAFGAGNERYHWYDSVVIELKDKATGELSVFEFGGLKSGDDIVVDENYNLDNYECTRIKGFIYYINFSLGDLPVDTALDPGFPEVEGMLFATPPGYLHVFPGTNAIYHTNLKDWLS